jgi:hypothetical protein
MGSLGSLAWDFGAATDISGLTGWQLTREVQPFLRCIRWTTFSVWRGEAIFE